MSNENKRIIFMGTPSFAQTVLDALIEAKYTIVLVVSQPNKPVGRKKEFKDTPTVELAKKHNIPVFQPEKLKEGIEEIASYMPDLIITAAYGQFVPTKILELPTYGAINVHGSLLPKYRGGAPIHHAIINGEKETGITIMYMDRKMDAGDIISQSKMKISENDTLDVVYEQMEHLGAKALLETLPAIFSGTNARIAQDETKVTYGLNITREEEKIDFGKEAIEVHNRIRGLSPHPGAYAIYKGKRVKLYVSEVILLEGNDKEMNFNHLVFGTILNFSSEGLDVLTASKDTCIRILEVQLEGKKRMRIKDAYNGLKNIFIEGEQFDES